MDITIRCSICNLPLLHTDLKLANIYLCSSCKQNLLKYIHTLLANEKCRVFELFQYHEEGLKHDKTKLIGCDVCKRDHPYLDKKFTYTFDRNYDKIYFLPHSRVNNYQHIFALNNFLIKTQKTNKQFSTLFQNYYKQAVEDNIITIVTSDKLTRSVKKKEFEKYPLNIISAYLEDNPKATTFKLTDVTSQQLEMALKYTNGKVKEKDLDPSISLVIDRLGFVDDRLLSLRNSYRQEYLIKLDKLEAFIRGVKEILLIDRNSYSGHLKILEDMPNIVPFQTLVRGNKCISVSIYNGIPVYLNYKSFIQPKKALINIQKARYNTLFRTLDNERIGCPNYSTMSSKDSYKHDDTQTTNFIVSRDYFRDIRINSLLSSNIDEYYVELLQFARILECGLYSNFQFRTFDEIKLHLPQTNDEILLRPEIYSKSLVEISSHYKKIIRHARKYQNNSSVLHVQPITRSSLKSDLAELQTDPVFIVYGFIRIE